MRLIKKIKFNRVKEVAQYKKLKTNFEKLKAKNSQGILASIKDISRLNFYFVLEYINIIHEKINYDKIFPDTNGEKHSKIDFSILIQEQDKLKNYIQEKQNKGPDYFKKLGILNEVVGCFIVGTIKKNIRSIEKLDLTKKDYNVVVKIDIKNLPKEFEQICNDFSKNKQDFIEREHEEFEKFMSLNSEEKDTIIQDILHNIQYPPIIFMDLTNDESFQEDSIVYNSFFTSNTTATTIEIAAENNIDNIKDKSFLEGMLSSALEKENYELCAKIRDRLLILNNLCD